MQRSMWRRAWVLVLGFAVSAQAGPATAERGKVYSEAEALQIGWPMLAGPYSTFEPLRTQVRLVDDLAQGRVAWITQDDDYGTSKTGSQSYTSAKAMESHIGPNAKSHPGNWANVVVGEGKLFASSFRPVGEWFKAPLKEGGETVTYRLDAEDLTFAADLRTGVTLWKAAEPGGIVRAGGKRGGFQVAPVYYQGKVFSMGSTGRLFAYRAADGNKLWQADIGAAYRQEQKDRDAALAAARAGQLVKPDGPGWHSSLVVADGVLVTPTFAGGDSGLRGVDVETGQTKWEVAEACSRWSTPAVWRHGDREYVLCATVRSGRMRLIDPRDGKVLWEVTGLGPNYFTLAPSETTVLANVRGQAPKGVGGRYGAFRIGPQGAQPAWQLPDDRKYEIPTNFDTCARQRYTISGGVVYVPVPGAKDKDQNAGPRFLVVKEETGQIASETATEGIRELVYLLGDRLIVRSDHSHGASRGGRHPLLYWSVAGGKAELLTDQGAPSGFDQVDFTNAYEVLMESPIVAGRMFERTEDGRLACYDLRKPAGATTWRLQFENGYLGMGSLPVCLWTAADGTFHAAKSLPPGSREAGIPWSRSRVARMWESALPGDLKLAGDHLAGTFQLHLGTQRWPVELDVQRRGEQVAGSWKRTVPALPEEVPAEGSITGTVSDKERVYPTPWLKDTPWTSFGPTPPGTRCVVLQLDKAMSLKNTSALTLALLTDGTKIVQVAAAAYGYSQGWPEVDASGLTIRDGAISGEIAVLLHGDSWMMPNPQAGTGAAGKLQIDAKLGDGAVTGSFKGRWGMAHTVTGKVTGTGRREE